MVSEPNLKQKKRPQTYRRGIKSHLNPFSTLKLPVIVQVTPLTTTDGGVDVFGFVVGCGGCVV
jgi:hypothetical protein